MYMDFQISAKPSTVSAGRTYPFAYHRDTLPNQDQNPIPTETHVQNRTVLTMDSHVSASANVALLNDDIPQEHWMWLAHKAFQGPIDQHPVPSEVDVICGRGGLANHHPGNVAFRKQGALMRPAYMALPEEPKREKTRLAFELIQWVFSKGGRFLTRRRSDEPWTIATWEQIQKKASQILRTATCEPKATGGTETDRHGSINTTDPTLTASYDPMDYSWADEPDQSPENEIQEELDGPAIRFDTVKAKRRFDFSTSESAEYLCC